MITPNKKVVGKAAMIDTEYEFCGLKIFLLVPLVGDVNPKNIVKEFRGWFKHVISRATRPNVRDIFLAQQKIARRITGQEPIVEN